MSKSRDLEFFIREFGRANFTHVNDLSKAHAESYEMNQEVLELLKTLRQLQENLKENK